MTDYLWSTLRDNATRHFKDSPSASQEQRIIDVFKERPELVAAQIDHVAQRYAEGHVTNPWPFLATSVENAIKIPAEVEVTSTNHKARATRRAEQWIRNAGCYFDRETELLDELFGHHGTLKEWAEDQPLRERLTELWANERHRGAKAEAEAETRARQHA